MDKQQAADIINANIYEMSRDLYIEDWQIVVALEMPVDSPANTAACVSMKYPYKIAMISMNLELLITEEKLLDSLLHEMLHIVLAPYDNYAILSKESARNKHELGLLDYADMVAAEQTVHTLERIFKHRIKYIYPTHRNTKENRKRNFFNKLKQT